MKRWQGIVPVLVAVVAVSGCGSDDEPTGLDALRETSSSSPEPTPAPPSVEPTPDPDAGFDTEFPQPYLPEDEPSTVELRDSAELEGVDDLDDEQAAVVADLGEFVADWDAVLFGVPFEDSGVEETATGDQLATLRAYAEESVDLERVIVGAPTTLRILDVTVAGEEATVEACLLTAGWTEVRGGAFHDVIPAVERSTLGLAQESGRWLAQSSVSGDASECDTAD